MYSRKTDRAGCAKVTTTMNYEYDKNHREEEESCNRR